MKRLLDLYCRALKWIAVLLLFIMVLLVFGNVVLRYAFNSGITVAEELSRWLFMWLTFLGSIYALREHQHLGTDTLISRLPPRGRQLCLIVANLFMLWVCWLIFSGALAQTRLNWNVTAPSSGFSLGWFYSAGIVFAVSAAVILIEQIIWLVRGNIPRSATAEEQA
ncbi:TRAP-type C4-dicarboxylate transport system, small permease component [Devosia lucknowensis]|uniref:TRAP transporter small permease protein n=1 Tax=Devosia lucknowensis TaxID=1096929 RepID=A0A1Y6G7W7_9HYPH|nr:TRAP transporter small permease [Devosia lucknowensis]SMQ86196.1 TRAP-type C4-dicarboxylate transport system, small permease component [Devosia lucknowensis]